MTPDPSPPAEPDRGPPDGGASPGTEERSYSGDMVLLVLFIIIAIVLCLLFYARSQAQ